MTKLKFLALWLFLVPILALAGMSLTDPRLYLAVAGAALLAYVQLHIQYREIKRRIACFVYEAEIFTEQMADKLAEVEQASFVNSVMAMALDLRQNLMNQAAESTQVIQAGPYAWTADDQTEFNVSHMPGIMFPGPSVVPPAQ